MNIRTAQVIQSQHGPDTVMLHTDLPDATHPFTGTLVLKFTAARDTGPSYMATHFPDVTVEVVARPSDD